MDIDSLSEIVTRLRDAGVVECEFDARDRLRRLVLRIPESAPRVPSRDTLFEVPPVGLSDPFPMPAAERKRDQLRDLVSDTGIPDELADEVEPGPVKVQPSE